MGKVIDATGRELKAGQWVVQPYSQGRSIGTRISYIIAVEEGPKGHGNRVQLTHFSYNQPGGWVNNQWVYTPEKNHWTRAVKRWVGGGDNLVILDEAVAFAAQPSGLAEWIETVMNGDPLGDIPEVVDV